MRKPFLPLFVGLLLFPTLATAGDLTVDGDLRVNGRTFLSGNNTQLGINTLYPQAIFDLRSLPNSPVSGGSIFSIVDPAFPGIANASSFALGQIHFAPIFGQTTVLSLGRRASSTFGNVNGDGTVLGTLLFNGVGTDGGTYRKAVEISAIARTNNWGNGWQPADVAFLLNSGNNTTNLVERLRISHDGKIGVGIAAPRAKLDVVGDGRFSDQVSFYNGSATTPSIIIDPVLGRILANGQSLLTPNASGAIGIGTVTPSAKLDIVETANTAAPALTVVKSYGSQAGSVAIFERTHNIPAPSINPGNALLKIREGGGVPLYITNVTESVPWFIVNQLGNVGIGTAAPTAKLDVNGGAFINGKLEIKGALSIQADLPNAGSSTPGDLVLSYGKSLRFANDVNNNSSGVLSYGTYGGVGNSLLIGNSSGTWPATIQFRTASYPATPSERMRIDANGNVGIGTTTPTKKLEVAGDAKITGVITCAPGGDIPMYSGN